MVNKVAVIAVVAILAVPILIGYGMNLEPTTVTEYLPDQDSVNVTQLLQNDVGYSMVHADTYQLNTNFSQLAAGADGSVKMLPVYEKIVRNYNTSYSLRQYTSYNQSWSGANTNITDVYFYAALFYDVTANNHHNVAVYYDNNGVETLFSTIIDFHSIYIDRSVPFFEYSYYNNDGSITMATGSQKVTKLVYTTISGRADSFSSKQTNTYFADLSAGYYFRGNPDNYWSIDMPERTSSAIMTMNLDSISTSSTYRMWIGVHEASNIFRMDRTVSGGDVSWKIHKSGYDDIDLYYDPSRSDNTYQIRIDFEFVRTYMNGLTEMKEYNVHFEFRYVGGWPATFGEANYYQKYDLDVTYSRAATDPSEYLDRINFAYPSVIVGKTPTIRMDDALFAGFEYPVISNKEYDPVSFKANPSTTLKNISQYGDSIIFAGETYTVGSDGNIMIGTHKASLNGIVFDSIPVAGGYENRINGYVISTTAQPSTINFKGAWVASVATDSQSTNTYQTTVWHAGEFAWDGMDQNFLIVGLITSLAVFVGLGIYARKSNSRGVIPLMIVCGGAAVLFFVML